LGIIASSERWLPYSLTMKAFLRDHKKLAAVIGLAALLLALLQTWSLSSSARGRFAAHLYLRRGHYIFLTFGLEPPERRVIARLLRERYGIELRTVAGDIVSKDLVSYVSGYNEVMLTATDTKFGHNVYKECADAAYKVADSKSQ
jgi:hypothetical protein